MADVIRYGVIGTGMMGCEHIRNIAAIDDATVVAIADPHEESRRYGALACGKDAQLDVFADYEDLLRSEQVDALVVASPNYTHGDVMEAVFESGKHVLLEKPMCTTMDACHRVVAQAALHPSVVVQVGLEYRYMPPIAHFLRELDGGAIGDLKMLFIREHRHPFLPKVGDWNRFNRNTGGTLVEKCCHFFDLMNRVAGAKPARVFASGGQDVNHLDERYGGEIPDILDNAFVIVEYDNGVRACLDLCMFAESSRNEQEIVATGTGGKLDVTIPSGQLVRGTRRYHEFEELAPEPDPRVRHEGFHHGASYIEHLLFLDAIRTGSAPEVGVAEGLASVAIGVAAHRSIDEGRPVSMSELDAPLG